MSVKGTSENAISCGKYILTSSEKPSEALREAADFLDEGNLAALHLSLSADSEGVEVVVFAEPSESGVVREAELS